MRSRSAVSAWCVQKAEDAKQAGQQGAKRSRHRPGAAATNGGGSDASASGTATGSGGASAKTAKADGAAYRACVSRGLAVMAGVKPRTGGFSATRLRLAGGFASAGCAGVATSAFALACGGAATTLHCLMLSAQLLQRTPAAQRARLGLARRKASKGEAEAGDASGGSSSLGADAAERGRFVAQRSDMRTRGTRDAAARPARMRRA